MDNITYDDFTKLQMVVARIVSAEPIKGKTRIMKGVVDCGGGDERTVIIGGAQYYLPEEMIGRKAVVITNLEPKSVAGVESGAMLLAADVNNKPFWLVPDEADQVPVGSIIR